MFNSPQYNYVSKSIQISDEINFDHEDKNEVSISANFINTVIHINCFDDEELKTPVKPTTGSFKVYVKTLGNDAWRLLEQNDVVDAKGTGGAAMDINNDTELNLVSEPSMTAHVTHIKVKPLNVDVANFYRVSVVQDSQGGV